MTPSPATKTGGLPSFMPSLLALFAGALFPLGMAPLNWWPLIPLSMLGLFLLLQQQPAKGAFWRAFWFGMGFHGVGVSWVYVSIHFYGGTSVGLSLLGTALFAAFLSLVFFSLPFWLYSRWRLNQLAALGFALIWVLVEWVKSWLLSGFPWLWAGYGFIDTPLAALAPVIGVLGISAVVAISATALPSLLRVPPKLKLALLAALCLPWLVGLGLQHHQWTQPDQNQPMSVALIQGNIPQDQKWDPKHRNSIYQRYQSLTAAQWDKDIVLWPEAAYPVFYHEALEVVSELDIKAAETSTTLISGVARWNLAPGGQDEFFNSVFAIGTGSGMYDKQKLVPFGEYVPLASMLQGLIPFFNLPLANFIEGGDDQPPLLANGYQFSVYICYEIVYPELVRLQSLQRDFLITISNDAWFGRSWGPLQHFQMARMRALEVGRYLLRGTNTGITAIIDHRGQVLSRLPQFVAGTLEGTIYPVTGTTPFQRWGHRPVLIIAFFGLGWCLWRSKPWRRRSVAEQA